MEECDSTSIREHLHSRFRFATTKESRIEVVGSLGRCTMSRGLVLALACGLCLLAVAAAQAEENLVPLTPVTGLGASTATVQQANLNTFSLLARNRFTRAIWDLPNRLFNAIIGGQGLSITTSTFGLRSAVELGEQGSPLAPVKLFTDGEIALFGACQVVTEGADEGAIVAVLYSQVVKEAANNFWWGYCHGNNDFFPIDTSTTCILFQDYVGNALVGEGARLAAPREDPDGPTFESGAISSRDGRYFTVSHQTVVAALLSGDKSYCTFNGFATYTRPSSRNVLGQLWNLATQPSARLLGISGRGANERPFQSKR